jgi:DNA-binding CsgD family transcriptional regulator
VVRRVSSGRDLDAPIWLAIGLDLKEDRAQRSWTTPDVEVRVTLGSPRRVERPIVTFRGDVPTRAQFRGEELTWDWSVDETTDHAPASPSIPSTFFVETYASGVPFAADTPSLAEAYTYTPGEGGTEVWYLVLESQHGRVVAAVAPTTETSTNIRGRALDGARSSRGVDASVSVNTESREALAAVHNELLSILGRDDRLKGLVPGLRGELRSVLAPKTESRRPVTQVEAQLPHLTPEGGLLAAPERLHLTPAERRILDLLEQGLTRTEIAQRLGMSTRSVSASVRRVSEQLGMLAAQVDSTDGGAR